MEIRMKKVKKNKRFLGLCIDYTYIVRIDYCGSYWTTDRDGNVVVEENRSVKQKTLSGLELMNMFSKHLIDSDLYDFSTNGKTYRFSMFTSTKDSTYDFNYTILEERYDK